MLSYPNVTVPRPTNTEHTLIYGAVQRRYRIAHITDSHVCLVDPNDREHGPKASAVRKALRNAHPEGLYPEESLEQCIHWLSSEPIDAVALTGDIVHFPSDRSIQFVTDLLRTLEVPVVYCPGNHDWHFPSTDWNSQTRDRCYPLLHPLMNSPKHSAAEGTWSIELEDLLLVAFDNSMYQFEPSQTSYLADCDDRSCKLLFYHIPIMERSLIAPVIQKWGAPIMVDADPEWTPEARTKWLVSATERSTQDFVRQVSEPSTDRVLAGFCGHVHFSHDGCTDGGFRQIVTSPGFSAGVRIIDIEPSS